MRAPTDWAAGSRRRWLGAYTAVWMVIWAAQLVPVQLLVPLQLDTADDSDGWIGGVLHTGAVLLLGGIVTLIAGPVAGWVSDRWRGPHRRRPIAIVGGLLSATGLVGLSFVSGPVPVAVAWVVASAGFGVVSVAVLALIPDQLALAERGRASAAVSIAQAFGLIVGMGVIVAFGFGVRGGYLLLAVAVATIVLLCAVALPDPAPAPDARPAESGSARQTRDWSSLADKPFRWFLGSRFFINLGNALAVSLLLFYLMHGLEVADAETTLLLLTLVYVVFAVVSSALAGVATDRGGRRVPYVVAAGIVQAVAAVAIVALPGVPITFLGAAMAGIGYGVYSTAGLALGTDLLPNPAARARDLAIINIVQTAPQLCGPMVGALLVSVSGNFALLFAVSAVCSAVGAGLTLPLRRTGRAA